MYSWDSWDSDTSMESDSDSDSVVSSPPQLCLTSAGAWSSLWNQPRRCAICLIDTATLCGTRVAEDRYVQWEGTIEPVDHRPGCCEDCDCSSVLFFGCNICAYLFHYESRHGFQLAFRDNVIVTVPALNVLYFGASAGDIDD